ncbi:ATP-binding cassette domain-containing protein [Thalassoglobus polymorphus]|uniref:ATP-binding protein Uup n=1 Tax=Thalassoglobus polymorphus TaxID=2527994 RepID=A0A517QKT5_9PLAN|nr:ATP-binding cassette domain-containing protein [Thalassoglobus polymorphus]QDT32259.1 ABC transporter ATP-binding protein uup [Thalassoglobus polymorphus]
MSLISLRDVSFTWAGPSLLENINLEIGRGERIGLLGRNGAGKSTLMKLIAGEIPVDNGTLKLADGLKIGRLIQEVPDGTTQSVAELVREGLLDDHQEEWQVEQTLERLLTQMNLSGDAQFAQLSSGMKRRALLAQALIREPDLLLLDEPTNHLDIDSINWLESFLKKFQGTILFVTHDRVFLQALATRMLEIDRGKLFDWTCDYQTFLKRRDELLHAEEQQNQLFDKKLAEEEVWIRQGIKARRTRNEGRVRALKSMRNERSQRRERTGSVKMQAGEADRSGQLVMEAKNVTFGYEANTPIIQNFTSTISRGDKIGIVGPNGVGKSTLLKLILGDLAPTSGDIRQGTNLQLIYFDQLREQIDDEKTVAENVGEGQDQLTINGKQKHVLGYLQDFLFTPERARRPARYLSGGERNRMLLARIFKRPSNIMVLDEPTNDLDAETLELLEDLLGNYPGTVLLVSHDRAFLNNVVTSTLVLNGDGTVSEYDGGYDDYLRQRPPEKEPEASPKKSRPAGKVRENAQKPKLSYKEKKELEAIPQKIDDLEQTQASLQSAMADPEFFKQDGEKIATETARLQDLSKELESLYNRWEELAAKE